MRRVIQSSETKSDKTMTKSDKTNSEQCKKKSILVYDQPNSETRVLNHPIKEKIPSNPAIRKVNRCLNPNKPQPISLQKNSLLKLEKTIKETENLKFKPVTDASELPISSQVTLEEKITKHMNYPIEKKLYKELISLNLTTKQQSLPTSLTYEPSVKDREPKLENYFQPISATQRPIPVAITFPPSSSNKTYNGYRTYQIMKSWAN